MPVPDEVVFGHDTRTGAMTYGDVRSLDDEGKLRALKRRLDTFFIVQVDELGKAEKGDSEGLLAVSARTPDLCWDRDSRASNVSR